MFAAESTREWASQREIDLAYAAETGSTNSDAKARAATETADLRLYLAAHQNAGRGRGDHHWLDTGAGECLLSTWSFRLQSAPQAITAPRIGLALFQAARRAWPSLPFALKAPNDLFLGGLKCGGLLIEGVSGGDRHRLLIGLGLNVLNHPRGFGTATHLNAALGRAVETDEWSRFLDELLLQLRLALAEITSPRLSDTARAELRSALNANPNRPDKIEEVTPDGDLISPGRKVPWTEL